MVLTGIADRALQIVKSLHPRYYLRYFKAFYAKYGAIVTFLLIYYVAGHLYMLLKTYGLWFKKSVRGQHAFITGAGSGIGRRMAILLSQKGAKISVTDINPDAAEGTVTLIKNKGGFAHAIKLDVTSVEDIHNAHETAKAKFGDVHILINNAGITNGKKIVDLTKKEIDSVFMVNAISHIYTVKEFLPTMLKNNKGHVVTIASAAATVGIATNADYSASKWACFGFDESLRTEMAKIGANIKTTCICPYYINTGMFDGVKSKAPAVLPFLDQDWMSQRIVNAILQEEPLLITPLFVTYNYLVRAIFPVAVFDWIHRLVGTSSGMDEFIGRNHG